MFLLLSIFFIILVPVLIGIYLYTPKSILSPEANKYYEQFLKRKKKKILLLTAHPDDECMFFAPSIKGLCRSEYVELHILCITNGDYDGLGKQRELELINSTRILGVHHSSIHGSSDFQDGQDQIWDLGKLVDIIDAYISTHSISKIITFDQSGVSGHANHVSLYYAVRKYINERVVPEGFIAYKLTTTNLLRKYMSIGDVPYSYMMSDIMFVSGWLDIFTSIRAMFAHRSQMVWFRYLYIFTSRYMIVNTLEKIVKEDVKAR